MHGHVQLEVPTLPNGLGHMYVSVKLYVLPTAWHC